MKKKWIIMLIIFINCLLIHINTYSKYIINRIYDVAQVNIDRTRPILSVTEVKNSNIGYEKYANKEQIITLKVEVNEKNMKTYEMDKGKVQILVGDSIITPEHMDITKQGTNLNITTYKIVITGIVGNGKLQIKFKEGTVIDTAGWENLEYIFDTNIMIDNIVPQATFSQIELISGNSQGVILTNEPARPIQGWDISPTEKSFKIIFKKKGIYIYTIKDYAGNVIQVTAEIKR